MKVFTMIYRTHNPYEESHGVSRLRENLTSGSDGEGLETGQVVPRQSFTRQETIRFIKQTYDLENIRVLKYARLQNMMALLLAVFYFVAVILDQSQKLTVMAGHILKSAKRVFGIPDFKHYALGDGLSNIFSRFPGQLQKQAEIHQSQLSFGFG